MSPGAPGAVAARTIASPRSRGRVNCGQWPVGRSMNRTSRTAASSALAVVRRELVVDAAARADRPAVDVDDPHHQVGARVHRGVGDGATTGMPDQHDVAIGGVDRRDDRVDVVAQRDAGSVGVPGLHARQGERPGPVPRLLEHGDDGIPGRGIEPQAGDEDHLHGREANRYRPGAVLMSGAPGRGVQSGPAWSSRSDVSSSRSGRTWMKYSTPNISRRIDSGNIAGSIGYWERCAAVARILWPTNSVTSMPVVTRASIWSPDGSDLVRSRRPCSR